MNSFMIKTRAQYMQSAQILAAQCSTVCERQDKVELAVSALCNWNDFSNKSLYNRNATIIFISRNILHPELKLHVCWWCLHVIAINYKPEILEIYSYFFLKAQHKALFIVTLGMCLLWACHWFNLIHYWVFWPFSNKAYTATWSPSEQIHVLATWVCYNADLRIHTCIIQWDPSKMVTMQWGK